MLYDPLRNRSLRRTLAVASLVAASSAARAQTDTSVAATAAAPDTARAATPSPHSEAAVADSAALVDSVRIIARWLVANGAPERRANGVAKLVMEFARLRALDPLLVVGVIGVENATLSPRARSRAGARGVMQVMPSWRKDIPGCGRDIHDLRVNVCLGTAVLRIALDASESVREALLRYNGCAHARGCAVYASAVFGRAGYALLASRQPASRSAPRKVTSAAAGEVTRER
jgi:soluble lytic murein transglycosylase-like protein